MHLRRRNTRKDQALDAVASVTKTWSEWQLAKRAGKGVGKGVAKAKDVRPSKIKAALSSTPAKIAGAIAVIGGAGAVVARKLRGGDKATHTGPAPSEAVEAAKSAPEPEHPAPIAIAPDPATESSAGKEPAVPDSALRYTSSMPAAADMPEGGNTPLPEPDFAAAAAEPETADEPEPIALVEDDATTAGDDDATPVADDEPAAGATARSDADDDT